MRSFAIATVVAAFSSACFAQGMMGTTLDFSYRYPNMGTPIDGPTATLITGGTEQFLGFLGLTGATIDVTDSQMIFTVVPGTGPGWSFTPADFNGPIYTDSTNNLGAITSVTIDPASTMSGLTNDRIFWTADSFGFNFQGLDYIDGETLILNIVTPTPGAAALLGLGGAVSLLRRRR